MCGSIRWIVIWIDFDHPDRLPLNYYYGMDVAHLVFSVPFSVEFANTQTLEYLENGNRHVFDGIIIFFINVVIVVAIFVVVTNGVHSSS